MVRWCLEGNFRFPLTVENERMFYWLFHEQNGKPSNVISFWLYEVPFDGLTTTCDEWIIIVVMVKVYLGRIWQTCQITNRWRGGSCEILRQCRRRKGLLFSRSPWRQMDRLNIEGVTVPKEQEETRAGRRESRRQIATLTVDRRVKTCNCFGVLSVAVTIMAICSNVLTSIVVFS